MENTGLPRRAAENAVTALTFQKKDDAIDAPLAFDAGPSTSARALDAVVLEDHDRVVDLDHTDRPTRPVTHVQRLERVDLPPRGLDSPVRRQHGPPVGARHHQHAAGLADRRCLDPLSDPPSRVERMIEPTQKQSTEGVAPPPVLDAAAVEAMLARVTAGALPGEDTARIDVLRGLQQLKCAAEGAQAAIAVAFDASQRARAAGQGVRPEKRGAGVAEQVALARRESPHLGRRHLGLAKVLGTEMPHTMAALRGGHITEWRATILARETACLELEDRRTVDTALAGDAERLSGMGDRETERAAKRLACALDPASVAERRRRAESERTVSVRPAPDTMTWLTASLPVRDGVAVFAALKQEAARLVAAGDERTRGQIMADTLVDRVLGGAGVGRTVPPVAVNVVIGVDSLLGESDEPATIPGYGPIPAELVRAWIRDGMAAGTEVSLRRLFAEPGTGALVAMESSRRVFDGALADLIELRDQHCRTPWCDAPVRHRDHVVRAGHGGPTSAANGQGLCEACNYAKEAIGWQAWPRPGPRHRVDVVTPTGHRYASVAPPLTGSGARVRPRGLSPAERHLARLIRAA